MDSTGSDIKTECVEIVSEVDASSLTVEGMEGETSAAAQSAIILSPFMFERNEREIVIRFIELVRVCPEIWDLTSAAYREKILRRRSFRKIGEQMGWSYDEVLKKYNNLRTYYTKELIKVRRNGNYISKWPYFDQLDSFLRKTVHLRQQKHKLTNRWARLSSNRNTSDRFANYGRNQLSAGLRGRRQTSASVNNVRQRTSVQSRPHATNTAASSLVASASTKSAQSHSSVPSVASANVPAVSISHTAPSLQFPEREQSATVSRPPRLQVQSNQIPQPPRAPSPPLLQPLQHTHHKSNAQQRRQGVAASVPQMRNVKNQSKEQASRSCQQPSSASSSMESNETETSDSIFGKLIASQLAKIKEGRKKEQLKISLMQHILQAMFDSGDS